MARILVIEDDALLRELAGEILTGAGHEVITAEDGAGGLAQLDGTDLVIMDLMIPGQDGYELLRMIRVSATRRLPVVVVSGAATGEWSRRLGADRFIRKPFSAGELLKAVHDLLS